jgi:type IX secretion system PorP/SprF family membrane protein
MPFVLFFNMAAFAQNPDLFRPFYFNPYVFNAAYCGSGGYTEIELVHRQQWVNVNNAPSASAFIFQYPTQKRLSLGLNYVGQEAVGLRTSSLMTSAAYRIPLSTYQYLSFGLSLGVGVNRLDLDNADYSNDPTILQAAGNTGYADGNLGVVYTLNQLKIGFALTRLFGHSYFRRGTLGNTRFTQLKNQLYSIRYKFSLARGIAIEPYFLYRLSHDYQNTWEASTVFHLYEKFAVGGSYHNTKGFALLIGMTIKDKIRFSYSYEFPPFDNDFGSVSSHEFHLGMRFGKYKEMDNKN